MIRLLLSTYTFHFYAFSKLYVNCVHLIKSVCFIRVVMTALLEYKSCLIKINSENLYGHVPHPMALKGKATELAC